MAAIVSPTTMLSLGATPLYDEAAARELLMLVGIADNANSEELAFELRELGKEFAFNLYREGQASTPAREKQTKRLANALRKVQEIWGVADGGELLPMFAHGGLFMAASLRGEARGEAATMNALRAVDLLR